MKIEKISIVLSQGADLCMLWTDLPSTMPNCTKQNALFKMDAVYDGGKEYCEKHFPGVKIEVVDTRL